MLYPLPAVLVTSQNKEGKINVCTVAWAATVCTNPPMLGISLRPSRLTYEYIRETGVFAVNVTTEKLVKETDLCGVKSGRDVDKFSAFHLAVENAKHIACPLLSASPVNIECRVTEEIPLGSHNLFLARVLAVHVEEEYMDEKGKFDFNATKPIVYSHGEYMGLGRRQGTFGYSVKRGKKSSR